MPAVATCRQFGLPAYLQDAAIWLHGKEVANVSAALVGECAVIEARIEAQHGWQFDTAWPERGDARQC